MKGDCTDEYTSIRTDTVRDDSQMKGDCTLIMLLIVVISFEMTPK